MQDRIGRPQLRAARDGEADGGGDEGDGGGGEGDEEAFDQFLDDCEAAYVRQPSDEGEGEGGPADEAEQAEADAAYQEFLQMTASAAIRH